MRDFSDWQNPNNGFSPTEWRSCRKI